MAVIVVVSVDDIWIAVCVVHHKWDKGGSIHAISYVRFDGLGWAGLE